MDMSDKNKLELEKRGDTPINYHSPGNMTSDLPFNCADITSSSLGLVPTDNQMPICRGGLLGSSSCSSASMVDSFGPGLWEHSTNSQNLGFCDINVQNHPNTSNPIGHGKGGPATSRCGIDKALEMGWTLPSSLLRGGIFLPSVSEVLPQSLSQFPADSAFIERAARFSCFNGGNFNDMVNPSGIPESMGLNSRGGCMVQGPQEVFAAWGLKSVAGGQGQNIVSVVGEASKAGSMSIERAAMECQLKNEGITECLVKFNDEAKQGVGGSGNESEEAEFSGSGGREDACMLEGNDMELSVKSVGSKKRKRNGQDVELDQAKGNKHSVETAKDEHEAQQNGDPTPTSTPNKTTGKQGSHALDPPKEEYIHVRARRGQATNSHSLAERVRREKISERMKLLQDLVPGCSKVTGKAVMLDEIINYVQSLQRQVEFLSMKLATVNPRLDFNPAGLLGKDILHSRAVPSTLAFSPEMPMAYSPFNASQPGLIPPSFLGMESHSDVLRRTISSQLTPLSGGFKEPNQLPNAWNDELNNVVQMGYGTSTTQDDQDVNAGSLPTGLMKAEL